MAVSNEVLTDLIKLHANPPTDAPAPVRTYHAQVHQLLTELLAFRKEAGKVTTEWGVAIYRDGRMISPTQVCNDEASARWRVRNHFNRTSEAKLMRRQTKSTYWHEVNPDD